MELFLGVQTCVLGTKLALITIFFGIDVVHHTPTDPTPDLMPVTASDPTPAPTPDLMPMPTPSWTPAPTLGRG